MKDSEDFDTTDYLDMGGSGNPLFLELKWQEDIRMSTLVQNGDLSVYYAPSLALGPRAVDAERIALGSQLMEVGPANGGQLVGVLASYFFTSSTNPHARKGGMFWGRSLWSRAKATTLLTKAC